jgi:ABC-type proline/glycine betaine transport system permease subunit
MVVWTGWGILGFLVGLGVFLLGEVVAVHGIGKEFYKANMAEVKLVDGLIAGATVFVVGVILNRVGIGDPACAPRRARHIFGGCRWNTGLSGG